MSSWFGGGKAADPNSKEGAMDLKKTDRSVCYVARDAFYACARQAGKDSAETACAKLRATYETACPQAWVRHFDKKQVYNAYKQKLVEAGVKELADVAK